MYAKFLSSFTKFYAKYEFSDSFGKSIKISKILCSFLSSNDYYKFYLTDVAI
jgi:hypothetical protein